MVIKIDTHTHTISSGHAFSTLTENAVEAAKKKLDAIVLTEHAPKMIGGPPAFYFGIYKILPREICGVRIFRGIEANIIGWNGEMDIPEKYKSNLDFVVASLHDACMKKGTREENTNALCGALENPYTDAAGHPGNPYFEVDIEKVVLCAKRHGKLIEINNHYFDFRIGYKENCEEFARLCRAHGVRVCVCSDAHICSDVGSFDTAIELLEEVGMPEELVVNSTLKRFEAYLEERRTRIERHTLATQ